MNIQLQTVHQSSRIMVVDDDGSNRQLAEVFLRKAGFQNIICVPDGAGALLQATETPPDIILLDVEMPGLDGFEVCKKLKNIDELKHIPVLFLSAHTDTGYRTKAFKAGAVDYVSKPFNQLEMQARVEAHLMNGIMLRELNDFATRIREELELARRFQTGCLPSQKRLEELDDTYKVTIHSHFQSSSELSGDYWNVFPVNETKIGIAMADLTGHGLGAAMEAMRVHAMLMELECHWGDPLALTNELNQRLCNTATPGFFAAWCYCLFDLATQTLSWVGNGTPPMYFFEADKQLVPLSCSGLPLGIDPTPPQPEALRQTTFKSGDQLFIYSDALTEARHTPDNQMWLDKGLFKVMASLQSTAPSRRLYHLVEQFYDSAETPLRDDLTIIAVTLP